jgi:hypothetical protein
MKRLALLAALVAGFALALGASTASASNGLYLTGSVLNQNGVNCGACTAYYFRNSNGSPSGSGTANPNLFIPIQRPDSFGCSFTSCVDHDYAYGRSTTGVAGCFWFTDVFYFDVSNFDHDHYYYFGTRRLNQRACGFAAASPLPTATTLAAIATRR